MIHDPRDWALDVQVSVDILRSRNKICREPYKPDAELGQSCKRPLIICLTLDPTGSDPEKNAELIFCNPDLLWKSDYPNVRFGQGAFKEALQTVLKVLHCDLCTPRVRILIPLLLPRRPPEGNTLTRSTESPTRPPTNSQRTFYERG